LVASSVSFWNAVGKPLTVILDNASIHKAKEIQPLLAFLKGKGLTLYFLPPYSPELNRIEKLWHKMKYEWMAFKARSAATPGGRRRQKFWTASDLNIG
jgi:transposase